MAFHVACPITCNLICFCNLGFPGNLRSDKANNHFSLDIAELHHFLNDPCFLRVSESATVQVPVPKLSPPPPPPPLLLSSSADASADDELFSAQTKRASLQRTAAVASVAAEDFARRFESVSALQDSPRDAVGEEQGLSTMNVMCRLCFSGENEGTGEAKKILSCRTCSKKYHRSCLKTWAQNRDLFHWSSWTCPSCRICEVCSRTGDPNKFKFCRRCDAAYHCYCMQPPHKNVSSGPYLCPNHTRCHSCDSLVPGNGLSVRWFLGYTCCDACGRLFTKGNYCPVCLRVYRDSESTPMVCCDICQRWVHCQCDNISDEKYLQFQADGNLPYTCSTCRGECYQVKDLEDAVQELWRRRDEADRDLIATLRATAGLPTQEEIFAISPFSDEEDCGPSGVKNECGRVKLSLKGLAESSPRKTKKASKKKGYKMAIDGKIGSNLNFEGRQDVVSMGYAPSPVQDAVQPQKRLQGDLKQKFVDETGNNEKRHGGEAVSQHKEGETLSAERSDIAANHDDGGTSDKVRGMRGVELREREGTVITPGKSKTDRSSGIDQGNEIGVNGVSGSEKTPVLLTKKRGSTTPAGDIIYSRKRARSRPGVHSATHKTDSQAPPTSYATPKDSKPLMKLKFKTPFQGSWISHDEEEKGVPVKGQRSKRKRPSQKPKSEGDDDDTESQSLMNEILDANWILKKLGKDAIGKRVEVEQLSDNSWHNGVVSNLVKGTSMLSVDLDDGRTKIVELGKQGIRFVLQKQKRPKL